MNATISAGLTVKEMAELPAVNASFWFSYGELIQQTPDTLEHINDWEHNPMAALRHG
ncbi:MAG: hypothetical protein IJ427_13005 [Lachnospiraceae bacterium]|nr:hypothetical protein [Lachnospiraceae bacterium]